MSLALNNSKKGLILVFDLDQTIVNNTKPTIINPNIIRLLLDTKDLRGKGIDAIFLLTNNGDPSYISMVDSKLRDMIGFIGKYKGGENGFIQQAYFFDYIMSANHPVRRDILGTVIYDTPKSIKDIRYMMESTSTVFDSDEDILSRTYFLDDNTTHFIKYELEDSGYGSHYILIQPPFDGITEDKTNYAPIEMAITLLRSGKYPSILTPLERRFHEHRKGSKKGSKNVFRNNHLREKVTVENKNSVEKRFPGKFMKLTKGGRQHRKTKRNTKRKNRKH